MPFNSRATMLPSMGVDIGSHILKIVVAEQVADRVDIQAAGSFMLPPGLVDAGIVKETRKFGRFLGNELQQQGIGPAAAVMSVPSSHAVLRWVSLPDLSPEELREAARFKVKRHLPFPVDLAYIEASSPEIEEGETTGPSLVIAVRRDIIDSRAEALEYAGLIPVAAELEAQAILRVVERKLSTQSALWRDASLTIIDVGARNTHMYVVQNQRLQFIRGVKFGAQVIADTVSRELGLSADEAEELISHPAAELSLDGTLHLRTGEIIAKVNVQTDIEKLTREFLRLLRYFRSLHPERSYAGILDHVLVCGGLAGLHGFAEHLEAALMLRVERARPFAGSVGKFNKSTFESVSHRQEAFTVVMGLALAGLGRRLEKKGETRARSEFSWARSA